MKGLGEFQIGERAREVTGGPRTRLRGGGVPGRGAPRDDRQSYRREDDELRPEGEGMRPAGEADLGDKFSWLGVDRRRRNAMESVGGGNGGGGTDK